MKSYQFQSQGVCARMIRFSLDEEKNLHDVQFMGGCPGNQAAIGKLVEGKPAEEIAELLAGNDCGGRGTSCADQLCIGLRKAYDEEQAAANA